MDEIEKIPDVPRIEIQKEEKDSEIKQEELSGSFQNLAVKIKETINIDLFLPQIYEWISTKIKQGPTLIIGEKISDFTLKISNRIPILIARDSSSTYVSLKAEVKDSKALEKINFGPFELEKLSSMKDIFINIIIIFTLRKLIKSDQKKLLEECKRMLARDGQLIIVGEFYPKSIFLYPIAFIKEGIRTFRSKILKKRINKPVSKIDKLANELEFKFFDVKYDASGRIRTYILTKRWGALVS